jgi:hypothetical protein
LCCGALLLAFLDCCGAGGASGFGSLASSLLDHVERGTDNGPLRLDCTAGSLLGNFLLRGVSLVYFFIVISSQIFSVAREEKRCDLYLRNALLVLSSEKNGPCDATGVLALEEEGLGLAILESEDLAVTTDVELAL